jgi:hypothetical protein
MSHILICAGLLLLRPFVLIWFSGGAFGRGLLLRHFVNSVPFSHSPTMAGAGEKKKKVIEKGNCANSLILYCANSSLISFISYSNG